MRRLAALVGPVAVVAAVLGGCSLPLPAPQAGIECVRIADDLCGRTAQDLGWGDVRIIAMRLECAEMACTPANGSAEVTIGYRDGTMQRQTVGWSGAVGVDGRPIDPIGPIGPLPPGPGIPAGPPVQEAPVTPGPLPAGLVPTCIGIEATACDRQAENALTALKPGQQAVSIVIRCDGRCDVGAGSGTATLTFDDGSTFDSAFDYRELTAP